VIQAAYATVIAICNSELTQNDASLTDRHLHTDRHIATAWVNKVGGIGSCNFMTDIAHMSVTYGHI